MLVVRSLALIVGCACLLHADFDPHEWRYRRSIDVENSASAISAFAADASLYQSSAARLRDIRILRAGSETPYLLRVLAGSRTQAELSVNILNKAVVPQAGLQATLELNGNLRHNQLRIVTAQRNFKETVRVETSDDARHWTLARADAVIFDISRRDRSASDLVVDYPSSTRRYVRLTIPGWNDPSYLESAWLAYLSEINAVRDVVASPAPVENKNAQPQTTSLIFDLGVGGVPYDQLDFAIRPGLFSRTVEVSTSSDRKTWDFAGSGPVFRTSGDERVSIEIPEQWSRYVKIDILNGDSAPIRVSRITFRGLRRMVEFPSDKTGRYWLYSGNAFAKEPSYDFARLRSADENAHLVTLGKQESNPDYRAPELPWTDRNPRFLTAALIAAVIVMGSIIVLFLRKVRTA